jgi:hypothetical protein
MTLPPWLHLQGALKNAACIVWRRDAAALTCNAGAAPAIQSCDNFLDKPIIPSGSEAMSAQSTSKRCRKLEKSRHVIPSAGPLQTEPVKPVVCH